ncbi:hypothetical protein Rmet_6557 [Cupriavidus metallidurans CH34]|uniref:Uncharacterized protein n=1 Tax=Cupriavidus metallidurans (strain ATCC 43123 / DSM 2839 / NBRC 102507 / CH34) TaxID=266264 RepID=D3DXZ3_CUPMC|nr:hypothetical protein Rmet_6557 [Cupriavidus metallidurans CH34]
MGLSAAAAFVDALVAAVPLLLLLLDEPQPQLEQPATASAAAPIVKPKSTRFMPSPPLAVKSPGDCTPDLHIRLPQTATPCQCT